MFRRLLLAVALIIGPAVTTLSAAFAITCQTNCNKRCQSCPLGICVTVPSCLIQCEIAKSAACNLRTSIPDVIPPNPTDILDPKRAEEAICRNTYLPAYESFVHGVVAYCSNWSGRTDDLWMIDDAVQILYHANLFEQREFNNVTIRWCPIDANGMVPASGHILLHPRLKSNILDLAATLAHEMIHIQQFRRWPDGEFQCRYGKELIQGHGQGRSNKVEREAYDFEAQARNIILEALQGQNPPLGRQAFPTPPIQNAPLSFQCGTPHFSCLMNHPGPVGFPCWCNTPTGFPLNGVIFQ